MLSVSKTVRQCLNESGTTRINQYSPLLDRTAIDVTSQWRYLLENRQNGVLVWIKAYPQNRLLLLFNLDRVAHVFVFEAVDTDKSIAWHGTCIIRLFGDTG